VQKIPLHSLVFCKDRPLVFPSHEYLSQKSVEHDLTGGLSKADLTDIVFGELKHRVGLKLSLGERVVVTDDFSKDETNLLTQIASNQGAFVIEVTDEPIPVSASTSNLKDHWHGITVIGDIHGDLNALQDAMAWARSRNHFIWFLGDVIDYGEHSLQALTTVYEAVAWGTAAMIIGNHERKIARWLAQKETGKVYLRMSDGNKVTISAFEKLSAKDKRVWIGKFRSLLAHSCLLTRIGQFTLVHAAIHPSVWTGKHDDGHVEKFALYGEADHSGGKFKRSYRWVDQIPANEVVIVGHDVIHAYPVVRKGARGGEIVFLDTGCGKGGRLSSADLRFGESGLHLECFKRY
jgi:hypothetical protein